MAEYQGYKDGLDPKNILDAMEEIPAFMTQTPTGELSPLVEALQILKYDEDDPDECAESYKKDGNVNFSKKQYRTAVQCYTKGLDLKITKMDLRSALLFNRAAANFHLGNYRKCVTDCEEALKLDPNYVKVILKGAQALYALRKYAEAKSWINRGLALDESNQTFLTLLQKVEADEKKLLLQQRLEQKSDKKISQLRSAISDRGIRLSPSNPWDGDHLAKTPSGCSVNLTPENTLVWPVRILFPEVNQQEFVEQVEESVKIVDILKMILDDQPPEWDCERHYSSKKAKCYFTDVTGKLCFEVGNDVALVCALRNDYFVVENAMPVFFVVVPGGDFGKKYLSHFQKVMRMCV